MGICKFPMEEEKRDPAMRIQKRKMVRVVTIIAILVIIIIFICEIKSL